MGYDKADDAGVYLLDNQTALVQSVDFFTPVVDDPFVYGQISAANSLSDIYAMGGSPRFALSVVGFPKENLDEAILHEILRGGSEKMKEAGVAVIGGHSVQDPEIKFGYCVTGIVHPDRVYTNAGARPGDVLLLSKPLGTGIISTGIKFQKTAAHIAEAAVQCMLQLNSHVGEKLARFEVHSVTDITGYGLAGHSYEIAMASDVTLSFNVEQIPVLEGVEELAKNGMLPGGIESNRRYVGSSVSWHDVSTLHQQIILDPQTSGGLLVSLPEQDGIELSRELEEEGFVGRLIGRVLRRGDFHLEIWQ